MIAHQSDPYIRACMKTWLLCESCVYVDTLTKPEKNSLLAKCRNCANACFTLVCQLISKSELIADAALNCLLSCHECYEECKKYSAEEEIGYCGEICLLCASKIKGLFVPILN